MEAILTNLWSATTGALAFVFALGVIVFVHELGHHLVAKLFGVRVLVFSLGFGKRLWGFEHRGTDYRVSAIPLGGYVRMGGELPDEHTGEPSEFLSKPRWQRVLVYLAGPMMNVVLAVLLIAFAFMRGIPVQALQGIPAEVGYVAEGSAAEEAGLLVGDVIVAVGGEEMSTWNDVSFAFATAPERALEVDYLRHGERLTTTLTPTKVERYEYGEAGIDPKIPLRISRVIDDTPAASAGFEAADEIRTLDGQPVAGLQEFIDYVEARAGVPIAVEVRRGGRVVALAVTPQMTEGVGKIGVDIGYFRRLPVGEALVESVLYNADIVKKSAQILGKLLTAEVSAKSTLSGPIEIASISAQAARRGFVDLLFTMGFLSIAIGFMNLLPIPVLDGGHITILVIESLMRRDMSLIVKERITQVGFMMLMTLMAVVIFFDLAKRGVLPG